MQTGYLCKMMPSLQLKTPHQGNKERDGAQQNFSSGVLAMSVEDAVVRLKQLVTTHPELQGVALNLLSVQHKAAVDRLLQEPLVSITQALKSASALVFR